MEIHTTQRGFKKITFNDRYAEGCSIEECSKCSVQESSLATEAAIWLGIEDANPQMFIPYANPAWKPLPLPTLPEGGHFAFSTRMHLTQDLAEELIPILQHFVKTGYLPDAL